MKISKILASTVLAAIVGLCISCNSTSGGKADRGENAGGALRINETSRDSSYYPPSIKSLAASHICSQVHIGLLKFDVKNLEKLPAIAKRWETSDDQLQYTFHLRRDAYFHDDKCFPEGRGRKITASDFEYTFQKLATNERKNKNFFGTVHLIKGAMDYYKSGKKEIGPGLIEGIKTVNDSTLQITLEKPSDLFLFYLTTPQASVLAKEAVDAYGQYLTVGAGPFKFTNSPFDSKELILVRNENYFEKDRKNAPLPYLDSLVISFETNVKKELSAFVENRLDIVFDLSNDYINDFLNDYIKDFQSNPPKYVLNRSEQQRSGQGEYILLRSDIHNFFTNRMDHLDFSIVYLKEEQENTPVND